MAIPFLPEALIYPTASLLQIPTVHHSERSKLEKLQVYLKRRWLRQVTPQELLIYDLTIATNNAAESYHSKIKSIVKTCHPRIWTFLESISHIIEDTDNDIGRLREGREISRPRKKKDLKHDEDRMKCKQKLKYFGYTNSDFRLEFYVVK